MVAKIIDVAALIGRSIKATGWSDMRDSGLFDCSNPDHVIRTLSGLIHHARGKQSKTCNALALLDRLVNVDRVVLPTELAAVVADMNRAPTELATVDWDVLWPKIAARVERLAK